MRIAVYGTGAIGATVGGWLAESGGDVTFVARAATAATLAREGLTLYPAGGKANAAARRVRAVADAAAVTDADVVVLAVKNFDLEAAAADLRQKLTGEPVIVGLQNGLDNQAILPRHFRKVVYGVVCYNAWRDGANVFGYQSRGPVLLGVTDDALVPARDAIVREFSSAFTCRPEAAIVDAVKCKMLLNLANSVTTLVGLGVRPIEDVAALKRCTAHVIYEGMHLLRRAGVREVPLAQAPPWRVVTAMVRLPGFVTTPLFRRTLRKVHMSSMAQDVYLAHRATTELESLNGYFVRLADTLGDAAPYNRALYRLTRDWLARPAPAPIHEAELWAQLRAG
ncbi:MAG TPA: 2-dehydropantoate 2-reductase [Steroidobacteraceae bacterium]